MNKILILIFWCFGVLAFGQVQPYEIEPASAANNVLLSQASPLGEYDHTAISSINLSSFNNDLSIPNTWTDGGIFLYSNEERIQVNESVYQGYNFFLNGNMDAEFPSNSGLRNLSVGQNLQALASGTSLNFAFGNFNLSTAVSPSYNYAAGVNNGRYGTTVVGNFFNGDSNGRDALTLNYNYLNGQANGQEQSSIIYSMMNGFRNFRDNTSTSESSVSVGYLNGYTSTGRLKNSLVVGTANAYTYTSNLDNALIVGIYNGYNSPNINNSIFVGQSNGRYNTGNLNNSIYLGFEQAYSSGTSDPYRLHIGMYRNTSLIYGEFDNDLVRINGDFEVEQSGAVASTASIINGTNTWNLLNTGASGDLVIEPQTIDGDVIFRDQTNDEWFVLDNTNKKVSIDEDDLVPTSETDMQIAAMQDNGTNREIVSIGIGDGLFYDSTTDEIASSLVAPLPGVFKDASLVVGAPTYEDYAEFTETIDLGANYSISGDVITVSEEGVYFFAIAFEPSVVAGTTLNRITLEINAADYLERDYDELVQTITMTGYLNLSASDTLKLSIQQFPNGGTATDIQFTIHRVGVTP